MGADGESSRISRHHAHGRHGVNDRGTVVAGTYIYLHIPFYIAYFFIYVINAPPFMHLESDVECTLRIRHIPYHISCDSVQRIIASRGNIVAGKCIAGYIQSRCALTDGQLIRQAVSVRIVGGRVILKYPVCAAIINRGIVQYRRIIGQYRRSNNQLRFYIKRNIHRVGNIHHICIPVGIFKMNKVNAGAGIGMLPVIMIHAYIVGYHGGIMANENTH